MEGQLFPLLPTNILGVSTILGADTTTNESSDQDTCVVAALNTEWENQHRSRVFNPERVQTGLVSKTFRKTRCQHRLSDSKSASLFLFCNFESEWSVFRIEQSSYKGG